MTTVNKWRKYLNLHRIDEALLRHWYLTLQPIGSGPRTEMRMICALIEEIAELKGIDLSLNK